MNKQERQIVWQRAQLPCSEEANQMLWIPAEGLSYTKTVMSITVEQAAAFLRYQALFLNGNWDMAEVNNMFDLMRWSVQILDAAEFVRMDQAVVAA